MRPRTLSIFVAFLSVFITANTSVPSFSQVPPPSIQSQQTLLPPCIPPNVKYTAVPTPPPDQIAIALSSTKRYRLVIGAGEYSLDATMDRSYVDTTAKLVDERLSNLGYLPLPSFPADRPFLVGSDATKSSIMAAVREMVNLTSGVDHGVIYYVGHGLIAPSNTDLSLGVYDRLVAPDEGIRLSDLIGTLEFSDSRSSIQEIPHFLIVLDACLSGNAALGVKTVLTTKSNVQSINEIENQIVPPQIAILSATADGDSSNAYNLHGTSYSAFGYYFARALKEDWACADSITPDGILTLDELRSYLADRLKLAYQAKTIDASMSPSILNKDQYAFIAYDPSKHAIDGLRSEIINLEAVMKFEPI